MGWTVSADTAPNPLAVSMSGAGTLQLANQHIQHSSEPLPTATRVLGGVQGAKHHALHMLRYLFSCQASLVPQSSLGHGQPCPGGGGSPGLAEQLLMKEKSMPSQEFLPRGWFTPPCRPGGQGDICCRPSTGHLSHQAWSRSACQKKHGEAAASPAVCNGITQNEGHHRPESNVVCLRTHTARYTEQRPCTVKVIP